MYQKFMCIALAFLGFIVPLLAQETERPWQELTRENVRAFDAVSLEALQFLSTDFSGEITNDELHGIDLCINILEGWQSGQETDLVKSFRNELEKLEKRTAKHSKMLEDLANRLSVAVQTLLENRLLLDTRSQALPEDCIEKTMLASVITRVAERISQGAWIRDHGMPSLRGKLGKISEEVRTAEKAIRVLECVPLHENPVALKHLFETVYQKLNSVIGALKDLPKKASN